MFDFLAPREKLPPQFRRAQLVDGSIRAEPEAPAKPVVINVVATEADNVTAVFGGNWRAADLLTAIVPYGDRQGYRIDVAHIRPKAVEADAAPPAESLRLAILRDGRTLQEAEYPLETFPDDVLRLEYRRERGSLYARIGDRPGISFEDSMSIVGVPGVFALTFPPGVALERVEILQKKIEAAAGDLDRADQDFYAGKYREAERLYATVARDVSGAFADESNYKRGLALAKLENPAEAEAAFQAASADPLSRWSILATGELWERALASRGSVKCPPG